MKKVAIWGFHYGNYGDDAMTIQFARELARLGADPYIYRLPQHLSQKYEIKSCDRLEEFVRQADIGFIAAGGILADFDLAFFEYDILRFHEMSLKHDCPLFSLSIGGDKLPAILSENRKALFGAKNFCGGTVRHQQDVETMRQFGKDVSCFPDVLLSMPEYWDYQPQTRDDNLIHIGINASQKHDALLLDLEQCINNHPNVMIHFLVNAAHYNLGFQSEVVPKLEHPRLTVHPYVDPELTMSTISALDILLSDRLHLGVTAVSMGVPFLSFATSVKTLCFLKEVDAAFAVIDDSIGPISAKQIIEAALMFLESDKQYDPDTVAVVSKNSQGHMKMLEQFLHNTT